MSPTVSPDRLSVCPGRVGTRRKRGHIRRRRNSYQVLVYAGIDPHRKELRPTASTTDEAVARRILQRFRAQVDEQGHARTKATFRAALKPGCGFMESRKIRQVTRATRGSVVIPRSVRSRSARLWRACWRSFRPSCADAATAGSPVFSALPTSHGPETRYGGAQPRGGRLLGPHHKGRFGSVVSWR